MIMMMMMMIFIIIIVIVVVVAVVVIIIIIISSSSIITFSLTLLHFRTIPRWNSLLDSVVHANVSSAFRKYYQLSRSVFIHLFIYLLAYYYYRSYILCNNYIFFLHCITLPL